MSKLTDEQIIELMDEFMNEITELTTTTHAYRDGRFLKCETTKTFKFNWQNYSSIEKAQKAFLEYHNRISLRKELNSFIEEGSSLENTVDYLLENYTLTKKDHE